MLAPLPPALDDHAEIDWETSSHAGFCWNETTRKWGALPNVKHKGLKTVNAWAYSEHPSTDILTLSYRLPLCWRDTAGNSRLGGFVQRWRPGLPLPADLFEYLAAGGLVEAHKAMFERVIWAHVAVPRYGFPPLPFYQLRCSMAKARVSCYPGALDPLSNVLQLTNRKNKDGTRLLNKFSMPRNPTKADPRWMVAPADDPEDAERLYLYCDEDVLAEHEASAKTPAMTADETLFWMVDQEINWRGIAIDRPGVRDCAAVLNLVFERYMAECVALTGFKPTQTAALRGWLAAKGITLPNMKADTIKAALGPDFVIELDGFDEEDEEDPDAADGAPAAPLQMPPEARRALELRALTASASVKKLFAMEYQCGTDNRLHDLIAHHGARTGRPTGNGPQPLNLPRSGPKLVFCEACAQPYAPRHDACPWCGSAERRKSKTGETLKPSWSHEAVEAVLAILGTRDLDLVEYYFGDALLSISGCLRGLFEAGPGMELIASDYSSIEAVVIAMLAGEEWRIQAFRENQPIYLLSASKITGTPLETYLQHFEDNDDHHPDRQKIGKVAELANGFGGWIGSNKAFGSTERDEVIRAQILAWRAASPSIVELWGGQTRDAPWSDYKTPELFGYEGMAIAAIQNPGAIYDWRGVRFQVRPTPVGGGNVALYVRLLSGRELTYHNPVLMPHKRWSGLVSIVYWTWNSNPKYGPRGWVPMETYGGRLTENIVQATAHDVLRHGILALRAAGYPTVLHVYDEVIAEVPHGTGSIEEFERLLGTMPAWAHDAAGRPWPIRAAGGWRGKRYRKG